MTLKREITKTLNRLRQIHPREIDLSLGRIENLMARLGSPQNSMPPTIHVAGTNGKGSTIAFLRAMLEAAGMRVHVYTSPHLIDFAERIVLAGKVISEDHLIKVLSECERVNNGEPITFFEITTAAAFLAFAGTPADIVILETGLGGRLDATNIVKKPALTVITPISMDHMQFLGNSLDKIAAEKAAIQKAAVPSVIAPQERVAQNILLAQGQKVGTDIFLYDRDWRVSISTDGFVYQSSEMHLHLPNPSLYGHHQFINAGCAIAGLEKLPNHNPTEKAIQIGLKETVWPGRLEKIDSGQLSISLPQNWELWVDGGHNAGAGKVIGQTLLSWIDKPTHLLIGMLDTKQAREFLAPMASHAKDIYTVEIPDQPNTASASSLADIARDLDLQSYVADNVRSAISTIIAEEKKPSRILVCGSLYLLSHVYGLYKNRKVVL